MGGIFLTTATFPLLLSRFHRLLFNLLLRKRIHGKFRPKSSIITMAHNPPGQRAAMRINNFYLAPLAIGPSEAQPAETASKESAAAKPLSQFSTHTLSAELLRLIDLAQAQPEVRPGVVDAAKNNLAQGLYTTPASAQQTAHAILNAAE
jgi:hypothetical protein